MTLSVSSIDVVCGPHPQKRHRRDDAVALTARFTMDADMVFLGEPYKAWEFFGLVRQNIYRPWVYGVDGVASPDDLIYDEQTSSRSTDRRRIIARAEFDSRWESAEHIVVASQAGGEEAVRQKAIVRCPVCRGSVDFHDIAELRAILEPLVGRMPSLTLENLRKTKLTFGADGAAARPNNDGLSRKKR